MMKDEEEVQEEDIEDHYEDVTEQKLNNLKVGKLPSKSNVLQSHADDDIDFDYSQSHLDDFLRTHAQKNNIQSSQLMNTFLSSYSKIKSGTGTSMQAALLNSNRDLVKLSSRQ